MKMPGLVVLERHPHVDVIACRERHVYAREHAVIAVGETEVGDAEDGHGSTRIACVADVATLRGRGADA